MELSPFNELVGKRVLLCVTGSIAAYKSVLLARSLLAAGAEVQVVMTHAAQQFVGPATFSALTGKPVFFEMFSSKGERHVELAQQAELVVVAPATADSLARIASGRAEDLLSALLLCVTCPVVFAPAMHPQMYEHPLVQTNVTRLRQVSNWWFAGPVVGEVASGDKGLGRMMEPVEIMKVLVQTVSGASKRWQGKRVLITAGPTSEAIDPVRSLTNRSSGKMGFSLAARAAAWGATVTLIAGPVSLSTPVGVQRRDVTSALDMQQAMAQELGPELQAVDVFIMCAAVADYRPREQFADKQKRRSEELTLSLVANPDLLAGVGAQRTNQSIFLLGFAVETAERDELVARARNKIQTKRVDAIVANRAQDAFEGDSTKAVIVTPTAEQDVAGSKLEVADEILEFVDRQLVARKD